MREGSWTSISVMRKTTSERFVNIIRKQQPASSPVKKNSRARHQGSNQPRYARIPPPITCHTDTGWPESRALLSKNKTHFAPPSPHTATHKKTGAVRPGPLSTAHVTSLFLPQSTILSRTTGSVMLPRPHAPRKFSFPVRHQDGLTIGHNRWSKFSTMHM